VDTLSLQLTFDDMSPKRMLRKLQNGSMSLLLEPYTGGGEAAMDRTQSSGEPALERAHTHVLQW
jgi:hypothetical protein